MGAYRGSIGFIGVSKQLTNDSATTKHTYAGRKGLQMLMVNT